MFNAATYCLNITQNYALKNEPLVLQTFNANSIKNQCSILRRLTCNEIVAALWKLLLPFLCIDSGGSVFVLIFVGVIVNLQM